MYPFANPLLSNEFIARQNLHLYEKLILGLSGKNPDTLLQSTTSEQRAFLYLARFNAKKPWKWTFSNNLLPDFFELLTAYPDILIVALPEVMDVAIAAIEDSQLNADCVLHAYLLLKGKDLLRKEVRYMERALVYFGFSKEVVENRYSSRVLVKLVPEGIYLCDVQDLGERLLMNLDSYVKTKPDPKYVATLVAILPEFSALNLARQQDHVISSFVTSESKPSIVDTALRLFLEYFKKQKSSKLDEKELAQEMFKDKMTAFAVLECPEILQGILVGSEEGLALSERSFPSVLNYFICNVVKDRRSSESVSRLLEEGALLSSIAQNYDDNLHPVVITLLKGIEGLDLDQVGPSLLNLFSEMAEKGANLREIEGFIKLTPVLIRSTGINKGATVKGLTALHPDLSGILLDNIFGSNTQYCETELLEGVTSEAISFLLSDLSLCENITDLKKALILDNIVSHYSGCLEDKTLLQVALTGEYLSLTRTVCCKITNGKLPNYIQLDDVLASLFLTLFSSVPKFKTGCNSINFAVTPNTLIGLRTVLNSLGLFDPEEKLSDSCGLPLMFGGIEL